LGRTFTGWSPFGGGKTYSVRGRVGIFAAAGAAIAAALLLAILGVGEVEGALTDWQAFWLGLVQGATELLPISSSGHLILVPWLANWRYLEEHDQFNQTFDVALHLGTLIAVVGYFWHDLLRFIAAWFGSVRRRAIASGDERIAWFLFVATIPAVIIGGAGENFIANHLGEPWQIAILLAVFAIVLWVADQRPARRHMETLTKRDALIIGTAQALALAPGVSRSGITISAGRFLGLDRDAAARVSFLLLVPITLGAVLFKGTTDVLLGDLPPGWEGPFVVGVLAAAGSGLVAIVFLLGFVRRHTYTPFVIYRLITAGIVLLIIASGWRAATF
jgi:undecaprenyl-diphosphatase